MLKHSIFHRKEKTSVLEN